MGARGEADAKRDLSTSLVVLTDKREADNRPGAYLGTGISGPSTKGNGSAVDSLINFQSTSSACHTLSKTTRPSYRSI